LLYVLVEGGGGDCGYSYFGGEVFAELDVIFETEGGVVCEDEVGSLRGGECETDFFEGVTEVVTAFGVFIHESW